jgi:hypothetical protein
MRGQTARESTLRQWFGRMFRHAPIVRTSGASSGRRSSLHALGSFVRNALALIVGVVEFLIGMIVQAAAAVAAFLLVPLAAAVPILAFALLVEGVRHLLQAVGLA